jgi:hypothetical protein
MKIQLYFSLYSVLLNIALLLNKSNQSSKLSNLVFVSSEYQSIRAPLIAHKRSKIPRKSYQILQRQTIFVEVDWNAIPSRNNLSRFFPLHQEILCPVCNSAPINF